MVAGGVAAVGLSLYNIGQVLSSSSNSNSGVQYWDPTAGSSGGTGSPQCPPNDPFCQNQQQQNQQCPSVNKAVNTGLPHASSQGVVRQVFPNQNAANQALRNLTKNITKNGGFPKGSIIDPSSSSRVLVPTGNNGYAVYQVLRNGTARLKTVLIRRP